MKIPNHVVPIGLLVAVVLATLWSVVGYQETFRTWVLESFPIFIFLPMLIYGYRTFKFPNWIYVTFALHMVVLLVGAHYTYAEVPLGYWMQDWFGFTRNNYDKIGHFVQGLTPTLAAAELLFRTTTLNSRTWTYNLSMCIAMTVSAVYEIIEWIVGSNSPEDSEAFLGTQGYIWDTQTDMFMCLVGAVVAAILHRALNNCKKMQS